MCGSNSPEIDNMGLHELHVGGYRNAERFKIEKAVKDGVAYDIRVRGGVLQALKDGTVVLSGGAVVGLTLVVTNDRVPDLLYEIRVAEMTRLTRYRAELDGVYPAMPSYVLEWTSNASEMYKTWKNICRDPDTADDTLGMDRFQSVLFEGDRIRALDKTVYGLDVNWFNIGCAGHALSKMHVTAHTHAAQAAGFTTTRDDRTTMLKMLAADYCGDGSSFTVPGVQLTWADARDTMNFSPMFAPVEARWSTRGAECLDTPRVIANPTEESAALFGKDGKALRIEIEKRCGRVIPPCTSRLQTHLVSGNP